MLSLQTHTAMCHAAFGLQLCPFMPSRVSMISEVLLHAPQRSDVTADFRINTKSSVVAVLLFHVLPVVCMLCCRVQQERPGGGTSCKCWGAACWCPAQQACHCNLPLARTMCVSVSVSVSVSVCVCVCVCVTFIAQSSRRSLTMTANKIVPLKV